MHAVVYGVSPGNGHFTAETIATELKMLSERFPEATLHILVPAGKGHGKSAKRAVRRALRKEETRDIRWKWLDWSPRDVQLDPAVERQCNQYIRDELSVMMAIGAVRTTVAYYRPWPLIDQVRGLDFFLIPESAHNENQEFQTCNTVN